MDLPTRLRGNPESSRIPSATPYGNENFQVGNENTSATLGARAWFGYF
jgi:hypothetical protein